MDLDELIKDVDGQKNVQKQNVEAQESRLQAIKKEIINLRRELGETERLLEDLKNLQKERNG